MRVVKQHTEPRGDELAGYKEFHKEPVPVLHGHVSRVEFRGQSFEESLKLGVETLQFRKSSEEVYVVVEFAESVVSVSERHGVFSFRLSNFSGLFAGRIYIIFVFCQERKRSDS